MRRNRSFLPRLLVTGFGPFPGVPFNASAELVQQLNADAMRRARLRAELHHALLPTGWRDASQQVRTLMHDLRPDAVVHFGVSSRVAHLAVETRAFNATHAAEDCTGCLPGNYYVHPAAPPLLGATLPSRLILRRLHLAGIPAALSGNAGRYICNATLYRSLHAAARLAPNPLVGFIHIPALPENGSAGTNCGWPELRLGAWIILDTIAGFLRQPRLSARRAAANRIDSGLVWGGHHDNRPPRISDGRRRNRRGGGAARRV